jgi:long-chain acyl-CoA synthetase
MTLPENLKSFSPLPKPYKTAAATGEAPGFPKVEGETIPRRNAKTLNALKTSPHKDVTTAHDVIGYASAKYGNARAVGSRKLIKMHSETKKIKKGDEMVDKTWQYFELGPYSFMSFVEFEKLCLQVGRGLRKLGMEPGDKLHLFAQTHPHWLASAHGERKHKFGQYDNTNDYCRRNVPIHANRNCI